MVRLLEEKTIRESIKEIKMYAIRKSRIEQHQLRKQNQVFQGEIYESDKGNNLMQYSIEELEEKCYKMILEKNEKFEKKRVSVSLLLDKMLLEHESELFESSNKLIKLTKENNEQNNLQIQDEFTVSNYDKYLTQNNLTIIIFIIFYLTAALYLAQILTKDVE